MTEGTQNRVEPPVEASTLPWVIIMSRLVYVWEGGVSAVTFAPLPELVSAACTAAAAEGPSAALQLDVDGIGVWIWIGVVMICVVRFTAAQDTRAPLAALLAARQQG